jgi:MEDS: MEthanogen/methylotroph, DcmR Sensory domain
MEASMTPPPSWEEQLRAPRPGGHLVQLYRDDAFLARAVVHFLSTGLRAGEGAVVIGTPAHRVVFAERLAAVGLNVATAVDRGQLLLLDAEHCLAEFMMGGMPDRARFFALVTGVVDRARAGGCPKIRLFGEMVNLLWDRNADGALALEAFWNEVVADQGVSLLCAYRIDNFDRHAHRDRLHLISRRHSHLIPVEDYGRLEEAVDHAYADVFGRSGDGAALRRLMTARCPSAPEMPPGESALLALRELSPRLADLVLERARHHYGA